MLQKSQRTGQHNLALAFASLWLLFVAAPACAWDQGDPRPAPDYNVILAEKISSNQLTLTENRQLSLMDAALNPPGGSGIILHSETASVGDAPLASRYSAGWSMPVNTAISTGPVAQFSVEDPRLNCPTCAQAEDHTAGHVASLGWRMDSALGGISPWAQVSYSHQLNEPDLLTSRDRPDASDRENHWMDVSVGANVPLGQNLSAFASFAQSGAESSGEQLIYRLGVSASF